MAISYSTSYGDLGAGGIGWINFANMTPGNSVTYTGSLSGGYSVSFDMQYVTTQGTDINFNATNPPANIGAFFGNGYYNGINAPAILYSEASTGTNVSTFTLSNIEVLNGTTPVDFSLVFADAERTSLGEGYSLTTNGSAWQLFNTIGTASALNNPTATPANFNATNVSLTGIAQEGASNEYLLTTGTPSTVSIAVTTNDSQEAFALGFAVTSVTLQKNLVQRINAADQFVLNITGDATATATTTGATNGIQSATAEVLLTPGQTISLNEAMATGSVSTLTAYTQTLSAINLTRGGTIPPTATFPITNFTPALGDEIVFVLTNSPVGTLTKTATPTGVNLGDTVTYSVSYENTTGGALTGVTFSDQTSGGTTYVPGTLTVTAPVAGVTVTGTPDAATISSIPTGETVTVQWQERVTANPPAVLNIADAAAFSVNGTYEAATNPVALDVNFANVQLTKVVTPSFASVGDTVTYTLEAVNIGTVAARSIILTDALPAGTTYVAGSLTSNVAVTGTPETNIILTDALGSGDKATITFQAVVNSIPAVNPAPNSASATYNFIANPTSAVPEVGTAASNIVLLQVSDPLITITKTNQSCVAHVGDTITYNITVANTGDVPATGVVLTDLIPFGTTLVPGSLQTSVTTTGTLATGLELGTIPVGGQALISFQILVGANTIANPICNQATAVYEFIVDPLAPPVAGTAASALSCTPILLNDFGQQVTDLIQSVALEEAALANIATQEGAKIQAMVANGTVTTSELIALNNSVANMTDSIALLTAVLNQKLSTVQCQVGNCGH